jgi:Ni,Fe-hydrogenase III small subunit/NAD-dependent dihydropyrimidine dehydrogenase PreA subunit
MLKVLKNRFEQGCKTSPYPNAPVELPPRYRGRPKIDDGAPGDLVKKCVEACPQDALDGEKHTLDLGKCNTCGMCERISEGKYVSFTQRFELGTATREDLITSGSLPDLGAHAKKHFKSLFGRSLQLRQVSAAGCNACEADLNVLATPFFDLARFGINFVASPRHADAVVVTGPISKNMKAALLSTYEAMAAPKAVIAVGNCPISGGLFRGSPEITEGLETLIPVDLFIPGCPPHPMTNLHALLNFFK